MKKKLLAISFVLTALIILSGRGGAVKYPSYYTLHVPPPPAELRGHVLLGLCSKLTDDDGFGKKWV
jgi:hypothetical protein